MKAWIDAQDQRGRAYLDALPSRAPIRKLFDVLLDYPRTGVPYRRGGRYFNFFHDGLANQHCYGMQRHLPGPRAGLGRSQYARRRRHHRRFPMPCPIALGSASPISPPKPAATSRRCESGTSREISICATLFRIASTRRSPGTRTGAASYYSRYPSDSDPAGWDRKSHVVFFHRFGQPQSADRIIFRLPKHRDVYLRVQTSLETRLLKILARTGTSEKGGYYVAPLDEPRNVTEIFPIGVAAFWPLDSVGATHYALTTLNAPNGRLVRIDEADFKPDRWHTVIAESEHMLDFAKVFTNRIVAKHLDNLDSRITVRDLNGRVRSAVDFGGPSRVLFGRQLAQRRSPADAG